MRKAFDLRPLEFGDVMGRGFSLYTTAFLSFTRWFLLAWTLPMMALTAGLYVLLDPYGWQHMAIAEPKSAWEPGTRAAYYWTLKVASVAIGFTVGAAGVYYIAARMYVGGRPTLAETARAVASRASQLLAASFLHLAAMGGITLACFIISLLLFIGGDEVWAWFTLVLLGMVWVPVLGWYLGTWGLNVATVLLDDTGGGESFGRSAFLTRGFRVRLFGVMLTAWLLVGAPGLVGLLGAPAWIGQEILLEEELPLLGDLLAIVWEGALLPLFFIPQVVFYFDMRCRKEGYDLAVMARNFGIEEGEMMRYRMNPHLGYRPPGYKPGRGRRAPPPQPQPQQQPAPMRPPGPTVLPRRLPVRRHQ